MILLITLGFDERFALRAILRNGVTQRDAIYLFMSEGGDPRAEKAFGALREIVAKGFPELKVEKVEVPLGSFPLAVSRLRTFLKQLAGQKTILNLSGGQRALLVSLLSAALSLDLDSEVEVETEDSRTIFQFPLKMLKTIPLDELDTRILKLMRENYPLKIKDIAQRLGVSKPTIWRRLERMRREGLVTRDEQNTYSPTELGLSRAS